MKKPLKQRLTLPLMGVLVVILIILAGYVSFNYLTSKPIEIKDVNVDTKAALKLNVLKQISKKSGITEWELKADSATLLKDENKAILDTVSVYFFTKENQKIHLKSDHGVLNTKTHDLVFTDNVVVTYENAVMKTQRLQYLKKEHIIRSDAHVTLIKGLSVIEADAMTTRLNENLTVLTGHVKGKFSEDFNIR